MQLLKKAASKLFLKYNYDILVAKITALNINKAANTGKVKKPLKHMLGNVWVWEFKWKYKRLIYFEKPYS